jgi:ChrR Cupin-like domain
MSQFSCLFILLSGLLGTGACGSNVDATEKRGLTSKTVLDLNDVKTGPSGYEWVDFRPNVQKLIVSGAADTEHVAILWYTVPDGSVGLHYHSKTESVYVIDGTQTDAKGVYPTGTVYFNPPGSGHAIMQSSGFFILAYASPPDFASTALIEEYTPVRIDTASADLMSAYPFEQKQAGLRAFEAPLNGQGGMSAQLLELTRLAEEHEYVGNYLLVLEGSCDIEGSTFGAETLVVTKALQPEPFKVSASAGTSCLALGVSF